MGDGLQPRLRSRTACRGPLVVAGEAGRLARARECGLDGPGLVLRGGRGGVRLPAPWHDSQPTPSRTRVAVGARRSARVGRGVALQAGTRWSAGRPWTPAFTAIAQGRGRAQRSVGVGVLREPPAAELEALLGATVADSHRRAEPMYLGRLTPGRSGLGQVDPGGVAVLGRRVGEVDPGPGRGRSACRSAG